MNVLLAVPTRGYVWHEVAKSLETLNPQYVRNKLSVADCRNKIVRDFLKTEAEVLFMCDDDVLPPPGFMDVMLRTLEGAPYDILGAAVPIAKMPQHQVFINAFDIREDGAFMTTQLPERGHKAVDLVGTGVIAIRREVFEHPDMKRPFDQLIDEDGCIQVGQDLQFCKRAKEAGFTIGVTLDVLCDHYVTLHANAIAYAYKGHLVTEQDKAEDFFDEEHVAALKAAGKD